MYKKIKRMLKVKNFIKNIYHIDQRTGKLRALSNI